MTDSRVREQGGVKTILLVEDDVNIGEVLVQAISQETPYMVVLATSGSQALEIAHSIKSNLFILDYQLPQMNGIELYDQLQAMPQLNNVPTIMISALLPRQELAKRSAIRAMQKPIDLDEFLEAIESLIA